ncbi:hypothetical protein SLS58_011076 [Diplodia intermedia]|uniref:Uncharacterized protein n=1 Tax=Diplodia intermedia TaxID=856260 RepID=A0ABR3T1J9_9PEZI
MTSTRPPTGAVCLIVTMILFHLLSFSHASPLNNTIGSRRSLFSVDGEQLSSHERRSLFDVTGISDDAQKAALQQGQRDALDMARVALNNYQEERHVEKIDMWFGQNEDYPDIVGNVLATFIGADRDSEGADALGDVTVYPDDYWKQKDPSQQFCTIVKDDGSTGAAYFAWNNKVPGMHFCPKFFTRKDADDFLANSCSSIADHMSTATMTRVFQGANVYHEFMHYPAVTLQAVGSQVDDYAYNAWDSFILKGKGDKAIQNADTWVFYTLHIWLEEKCGKPFSYPRGEQDN